VQPLFFLLSFAGAVMEKSVDTTLVLLGVDLNARGGARR
jgi:hypothetical protein